MIEWFTIVVIAVSVLSAVICIGAGLMGKIPGDVTVLSVALIEILMIALIVMSIVGPFTGNPIAGDPLEYWSYLITAALIPIGTVVWAFADRTRWSTIILGCAGIAVAIMTWRMQVIWG